jgi:hypothetical protein
MAVEKGGGLEGAEDDRAHEQEDRENSQEVYRSSYGHRRTLVTAVLQRPI